MKYRTTFEADRDIIEIYNLGAEQFGVQQSERKRDEPDTASSVDIPVGMTVLGFKISALRAAA